MPIELEPTPPEEKLPEAPPPKTMVVRYGFLKEIGEFPSDLTQRIGCGTKLVVRTERGSEIAEMLTTTCGNGGCSKSITREKMLEYIGRSGGRDYPFSEQGRILRVATTQDLLEQTKLDENHHAHLNLARELVRTHKLAMKVVDVEHLLGGERILFYFVSEHRVDFRAMVRDLAHALHTRIELRQVGARDEARLTADYEKCGQHCCCKQFLKVLTPISMRSAKVQKATLDPTKISGRCGRLMCCLRYEDQTYEELRKKLPKRNTRVATEKGDAWVIDGQILTQLVLCQFDDGKREAIPLEKITAFDRPKPVMSDGRIMQTANDRPALPAMMQGDMPPRRGPSGPNGPRPPGPTAPPPAMRRPQPGVPVPAQPGDPLASNGPTGGDLNGAQPGDELDDLLADALDAPLPPISDERAAPAPASAAPIPPAADSAPANAPETPPGAREKPPRMPQPPRPPMNQPRPQQSRPPQQQFPKGSRPPQNQPPRGRGGPQGGPRPPQQQQQQQPFRPPGQQHLRQPPQGQPQRQPPRAQPPAPDVAVAPPPPTAPPAPPAALPSAPEAPANP